MEDPKRAARGMAIRQTNITNARNMATVDDCADTATPFA
jgi:hypothetical protein